jgi:hypothetical protein
MPYNLSDITPLLRLRFLKKMTLGGEGGKQQTNNKALGHYNTFGTL